MVPASPTTGLHRGSLSRRKVFGGSRVQVSPGLVRVISQGLGPYREELRLTSHGGYLNIVRWRADLRSVMNDEEGREVWREVDHLSIDLHDFLSLAEYVNDFTYLSAVENMQAMQLNVGTAGPSFEEDLNTYAELISHLNRHIRRRAEQSGVALDLNPDTGGLQVRSVGAGSADGDADSAGDVGESGRVRSEGGDHPYPPVHDDTQHAESAT